MQIHVPPCNLGITIFHGLNPCVGPVLGLLIESSSQEIMTRLSLPIAL